MKFLPDALTIAANFLVKLFFQHRLIVSFIKRDLSTRYLGSTLGVLWAVIHPLVLLISYTFIFAILFRPGAGAATANTSSFICSRVSYPGSTSRIRSSALRRR